VPVPASRIYWLDRPPVDTIARRALARAFDESALYDDAVRSASHPRAGMRSAARLARHRRSVDGARLPSRRHGA
jgi:hypothetical protein